MIIRWAINSIGYIVAHLPFCVISLICSVTGQFFFFAFRKRQAVIISNLQKAFPEKSLRECKSLAVESSQRMIELGLLSVALPFFSEKKIRKRFKIDPHSFEDFFSKTQGEPTIVLLPHFSQMEAATVLPLFDDRIKSREIGVIYRPFKNPELEQWIKHTRERFGLKLIPRGKGLLQAKDILKRNGIVVLLFDQNARNSGILTDFFGRIASTTNLPNVLYKHFHCPVFMLYPHRTGTFQSTCYLEQLVLSPCDNPDNVDRITTAMNLWLEQKLCSDRSVCCDWLWVHNRWHACDEKQNWLGLRNFRNIIDNHKLNKTFRVFVRVPNWLGDLIMAVPFIRAIRTTRPDAEITLLTRPHFIDFVKLITQQYSNCADYVMPIKKLRIRNFFEFFLQFWQYRKLSPDVLIFVLAGTHRRIITTVLRPKLSYYFSIVKKRFFRCSENSSRKEAHQIDDLNCFLQNMGYDGGPDLSTLTTNILKQNAIGLICGSANTPAKRWPIKHWVQLITQLLEITDADLVLFGTQNDREITQKIKAAFLNQPRVINRAGNTNLCQFFYELGACRCVIGNDTGGVHLSHFQGIPTIILFGPTHPDKTCPKFNAPVCALVAPDFSDIATLQPYTVIAQIQKWMTDKII